jgi:hypothetical protein
MNALRKSLIRDAGGDGVSAQRGVLVELLVRDVVLLELLDSQLLALGAGIVNRRARAAVKLLGERGTLADSVARRLSQLGLDRRAEDPLLAIRRLQANAAPSPAPEAQPEQDDEAERAADAELARLTGEHDDNDSASDPR